MKKKLIGSSILAIAIAALIAWLPAPQVTAHENIPDIAKLDCRTALFQADGVLINDFQNWYRGFRTGLQSAGQGWCADMLYEDGGTVVAQCPAQTGLKTVYQMLQDAKYVICGF